MTHAITILLASYLFEQTKYNVRIVSPSDNVYSAVYFVQPAV
jgi:hypothetical protein